MQRGSEKKKKKVVNQNGGKEMKTGSKRERERGTGVDHRPGDADKQRPRYKENLIRTAVVHCPGAGCTMYLDSQLLTAMKSAIVAPFAGDNCPLWR